MDEKVLIVDDDYIIREVVAEMLEDNDFKIVTAINGVEALDILSSKKNSIGVVICDIKMPKMSGEEVLAKISSLYPFIPVIMLTGFVDLDTALEVMRFGAFDYLTKPVDDDLLYDTVNKGFAHRVRIMREFETRIKEEKMAAVGMLTSGIVHNLSNPLTTISGFTELLLRKHPDEERLKKIILQVDRMKDMINNLMQKTRWEHSGQKKSLNINKLLTEEVGFLDANFDFKHNIEKVWELDPSLPEIEADYSDLSQSFQNIIKNSIDAMHDSQMKKLTITTQHDSENVQVKFSDTGRGIKEEDISRLFDPFFTTKPIKGEENPGEPTGTGLGLYICHQLLQPYGIKFETRSELGRGTDISVFLALDNCK